MSIMLKIFGFAVILAIYTEVSSSGNNLKIINGITAKEGEFPYMVQILLDDFDYFFCGGSIIGDRWILTAGHCLMPDFNVSIVYGTNTLSLTNSSTAIRVAKSYKHPKFTTNNTMVATVPYYDVGILELEEAIPFDRTAQPIQLADSNAEIPFHVEGVLAGWGTNNTLGDVQETLKKINLQLLNDSECTQQIGDGYEIFNSLHHLCSDDDKGGQCFADSGDPFVINGTQYGIASWFVSNCGTGPGAYSRITNVEYREFIKNVTGI